MSCIPNYVVLSKKDRYDKGRVFQDHVKELLGRAGYVEGQLYSTGGEFQDGYYERLQELGKRAYTSPDITVLNSWDHPEKGLDKRFGIACSRRDARFDRFGTSCVTFPQYQRRALREIVDKIGMPIYIVFGRKLNGSDYAVSVSDMSEPDEFMDLVDQSTGTERATAIYHVDNLWSWAAFIQHRIGMGDKEPNANRVKGIASIA
jgi:hypothetical protein